MALAVPDPDPAHPECIPTLNGYGYATTTMDEVSEQFVDFASKCDGPVLEVGTAYGVAAIPAIINGCKHYIANDLCEDHLRIVREQLPASFRERLEISIGSFPDAVVIAPCSLCAILSCHVLHFFRPTQIQQAITKMHELLTPGGKVFVVSLTPYMNIINPTFISTYERKVKDGEKWPGMIESFQQEEKKTSSFNQGVPSFIHLLDPTVLRREFESCGFFVERAEFIPTKNIPGAFKLDGREQVVLIAVKKH